MSFQEDPQGKPSKTPTVDVIQNLSSMSTRVQARDFPRKDHADPPQNVTKLFTGLLQPTLQEGTGSFVSGGPYGEFCHILRGGEGGGGFMVFSRKDP